MAHIYKITNPANGKIFVGSSVRDKDYKGRAKTLPYVLYYLTRVIQVNARMQEDSKAGKFDRNTFTVDILEDDVDEANLSERHFYWVKELRSYDEGVGYNLGAGTGDRNYRVSHGPLKPKQVICVETGVQYRTISEAARIHSVATNSIRNSMKRNGTCGGYHWKLA